MILWASVLAAIVVGSSAELFPQCVEQYCAALQSGSVQPGDKVITMLTSFGYNMNTCTFTPQTPDPNFPNTCGDPQPPADLMLTCAKKDGNGNYGQAQCFPTTIGFSEAPTGNCPAMMGNMADFLKNKCDIGKRRRRSTRLPGFDLHF